MERKQGMIGGMFILGGFLLMFGAVGGMDNPELADHFWAQVATAVIGAAWAWVGTLWVREDPKE